jgi:hypothetical protein
MATQEDQKFKGIVSASAANHVDFNQGASVDPKTSASMVTSSSAKAQSSGNNIIGVHYKIGRKIGEGSFGIIYEGNSLLT